MHRVGSSLQSATRRRRHRSGERHQPGPALPLLLRASPGALQAPLSPPGRMYSREHPWGKFPPLSNLPSFLRVVCPLNCTEINPPFNKGAPGPDPPLPPTSSFSREQPWGPLGMFPYPWTTAKWIFGKGSARSCLHLFPPFIKNHRPLFFQANFIRNVGLKNSVLEMSISGGGGGGV